RCTSECPVNTGLPCATHTASSPKAKPSLRRTGAVNTTAWVEGLILRTVAESFAQTKPAPTAICASKFVLLWTNGIGTGFPIGCPSGASWITPAKPREAARGGLGPGGDGDFPSPDT